MVRRGLTTGEHHPCRGRWMLAALVAIAGCGPVAAGEDPDPSAGKVAIVGAVRVQTTVVTSGALAETLHATGQLRAWREANLRAEMGGRLKSLAVDTGDVVVAGDVLLKVDGSRQFIAIEAAAARLRATEEDVARAQNHLGRMEAMASERSVAQAQVDNARHDRERAAAALSAAKADLRSARRSAKDAVIRAPIDGIVTRRRVDVGDTLVPGAPLMDVVDLSRLRVTVGLTGRNLGRIDPARPVTLTVDDLGGAALPGVSFASAATSSNPVTGLFDVEFHADNPGARGRAGMVATLMLTPRSKDGARLVVREALTRRGGILGVFAIEEDVAHFVAVKTGGRDGQLVELLAGPAPGTVLATSALHALADGVGVEVEAAAAQ